MAIIPKIENGNVVIANEYGGKLRSFSPNQGGKAVYVDYNHSNGKILVTTEKGIVIVCNENGGHLNSFSGNGNIAMVGGKVTTFSFRTETAVANSAHQTEVG